LPTLLSAIALPLCLFRLSYYDTEIDRENCAIR
jgi:hypothetical protein